MPLPMPAFSSADLYADAIRNYSSLPVYYKGQSKELRKTLDPNILIGTLIPSLYSYTHNRYGLVEGTDTLRLDISEMLWAELASAGIRHCFLHRSGAFFFCTKEVIPPIEIIVKRALVGTPAHIYHGLFDLTDRFGKPFVKGELHLPYVRFDYRNPFEDEHGRRLRDEMLPLALANRFIDTERAASTALNMFTLIDRRFLQAGYRVLDACFFLNESGDTVCGEIGPDNMRIKRDGKDADKDLWRNGRDAADILSTWTALRDALERSYA